MEATTPKLSTRKATPMRATKTTTSWEWDGSPQNKASGSASQLWWTRQQQKTFYQQTSAVVWKSAQPAGLKQALRFVKLAESESATTARESSRFAWPTGMRRKAHGRWRAWRGHSCQWPRWLQQGTVCISTARIRGQSDRRLMSFLGGRLETCSSSLGQERRDQQEARFSPVVLSHEVCVTDEDRPQDPWEVKVCLRAQSGWIWSRRGGGWPRGMRSRITCRGRTCDATEHGLREWRTDNVCHTDVGRKGPANRNGLCTPRWEKRSGGPACSWEAGRVGGHAGTQVTTRSDGTSCDAGHRNSKRCKKGRIRNHFGNICAGWSRWKRVGRECRWLVGGMDTILKNDFEFNCQMQIPPESKTIAWKIGHPPRCWTWTRLVEMGRYHSNGDEVADSTWADASAGNECGIEWVHREIEQRPKTGWNLAYSLASGWSEHILIAKGETMTLGPSGGDQCQKGGPTREDLAMEPTLTLARCGSSTHVRATWAQPRIWRSTPSQAAWWNRTVEESTWNNPTSTHTAWPKGALTQSNARRHTSTRSLSGMPRKNGRTDSKEQRRANNVWKRLNAAHGTRAAKRIKLQFAARPADPVSSSSASRSDATAGGDAASASNVVAGCVAQNAGNAVAGVPLQMQLKTLQRREGLTSAEPSHVRQKMTRNERNDSARRRRQNWRWKCQIWRRPRTAAESWPCDVTVGNWRHQPPWRSDVL